MCVREKEKEKERGSTSRPLQCPAIKMNFIQHHEVLGNSNLSTARKHSVIQP